MSSSASRIEYNRMAVIYDWWWSGYLRRTLRLLQDCTHIPPHARVLDTACGTGAWERLLLAEQPQQQVVGVDLSAGMLRVAQRKAGTYPHVAFGAADVTQLPFAPSSFDIVVTASALHYFPDPAAALAEMRRVLTPKGQIIILDWCRDGWTIRILDRMLKLIDPAHHQAYTQHELDRLLHANGLVVHQAIRCRVSLIWDMMIAVAHVRNT